MKHVFIILFTETQVVIIIQTVETTFQQVKLQILVDFGNHATANEVLSHTGLFCM